MAQRCGVSGRLDVNDEKHCRPAGSIPEHHDETYPALAGMFADSMQRTEGEPIVLQRAKAFHEVQAVCRIYEGENELIMGNLTSKPRSGPVHRSDGCPTSSTAYPYHSMNGLSVRYFNSKGPLEGFLVLLEYWQGKSSYQDLRKNLPVGISAVWDAGTGRPVTSSGVLIISSQSSVGY